MRCMVTLENNKTYFYSFDGRYLKRFIKRARNTFDNIKKIEIYEREKKVAGKIQVLHIIKDVTLDN